MAEPRIIRIPYEPRPLQLEFHETFVRLRPRASIAVCHRRFGKSVAGVAQALRSMIECERPSPRYAFIAPYLKQAKDIAWDYVHKFAEAIPGRDFNESELRLDLPGDRRLRLYGADNADSIQGIYLDGVVMDEYQDTAPHVFSRIVRPMLADRQGWVWFLGKPRGKNHFYELWQACQRDPRRLARLYRASETGILSPSELEEMRVGPPAMTENEYAQELECSWEAAIEGAYYANQLLLARKQERVTRVDYLPHLSVDTYWDFGLIDPTAVIFMQRTGTDVRIFDYAQASNRTLQEWAREVQQRGYTYGTHHFPHDAGSHGQAGGGVSTETQLRKLGLRPTQVHVNKSADWVTWGIRQAQLLFSRCWFDETRCAMLLDALGAYRQKNPAMVGTEAEGEKPVHDWASHGADAFRLMATSLRDEGSEKAQPRYAETKWDRYGGYDKISAQRRAQGSLS